MTDQPKRRGRPPKARFEKCAATNDGRGGFSIADDRREWADDPWSALRAPTPTARLRHKPGVGLQQAWQHAAGLEWRPVPTVAPDAADWEDA